MTISLFKFFCIILMLISSPCRAAADEPQMTIEVLSGGRAFDSFEAYAAFKAPVSVPEEVLAQEVPVFTQDVLGVASPLAQVLQDFRSVDFTGRPVCPGIGLAEALERAAGGRQGPLLLMADEKKVRIMELKHESALGVSPRTNP